MPIRAGLLRDLVRLERRVTERDEVGQAVQRWALLQPDGEVWARVEPLGGREGFGQQQWVATGDVRITIRIRHDVTPLDRVVHRGRAYDIVSTAEDVDALLIDCRARAEGAP
jgi:SPP1 family predicted phage head-tail adaptor